MRVSPGRSVSNTAGSLIGALRCAASRRRAGDEPPLLPFTGTAAGLVPAFWQRSRNRVKNVHWQGKVIGGLVGLAAGPVGVLIGLALGHSYDLAQEART